MITILSRLFIKEAPDTTNPSVRRAYGMLCSFVGIFFNILLFASKYIAGTITGSIAITADAGSSIITLVGFHFSGKKPDANHPFGHGRFEYICGFAVSAVIMVMGVELIRSSIEKIIHPSPIHASNLSVIILIISICIKLYMYLYNRVIATRINSAAMKATATDSLSDSITTTVVLASISISHFTTLPIDGWCGIAVGLFILYAGYSSARETLSPLLGNPADPELVANIEQIVFSHKVIIGIHDLIVHDYGPGRLIISLHGEVSGNGDIYEIHDAIDHIEKELDEKLGCQSCLHMDPIATDDKLVEQMRTTLDANIQSIDSRITIHDFRIVKGPTHTNLIFDAVIPFDLPWDDDEAKERIDQLVHTLWSNCYTVITIDKSYI